MRQMKDKMTKGKLDILAKSPKKAVAKKNNKHNKKKNKALKNIGKNVGALVSDVSVVAPSAVSKKGKMKKNNLDEITCGPHTDISVKDTSTVSKQNKNINNASGSVDIPENINKETVAISRKDLKENANTPLKDGEDMIYNVEVSMKDIDKKIENSVTMSLTNASLTSKNSKQQQQLVTVEALIKDTEGKEASKIKGIEINDNAETPVKDIDFDGEKAEDLMNDPVVIGMSTVLKKKQLQLKKGVNCIGTPESKSIEYLDKNIDTSMTDISLPVKNTASKKNKHFKQNAKICKVDENRDASDFCSKKRKKGKRKAIEMESTTTDVICDMNREKSEAQPITRGTNSNADTASKNVEKESETEMKEVKKDPKQVGEECRTICLTNLCAKTKRMHLAYVFRKYGKIDALRLRYPAVTDPEKSKRKTDIIDIYNSPESTLIGYIQYRTQDMMKAALEANGMVFRGKYLRVEKAIPCGETPVKHNVFIGNLPHNTEEKDVQSHFADCGEIEHVRILRNKTSTKCIGIGFVSFKSPDSIEFALQLQQSMFMGRRLRVRRADDMSTRFQEPQSKREVDKESPEKKRLDIVKPKQKKARIENSIPAADSDFSKMKMIESKEFKKDEKKTMNLKKSQSKKGMGKKSLKKGMGKKSLKKGIDIVNPKKKEASMENSKPAADSDFSGMKMIETKKFKKLKKAKGKFSKEDKKKLAISQKLTGSKKKLAVSQKLTGSKKKLAVSQKLTGSKKKLVVSQKLTGSKRKLADS